MQQPPKQKIFPAVHAAATKAEDLEEEEHITHPPRYQDEDGYLVEEADLFNITHRTPIYDVKTHFNTSWMGHHHAEDPAIEEQQISSNEKLNFSASLPAQASPQNTSGHLT